MQYSGLTIVIPTRNRAKLAINSIQSILEQSVENIQIIVSDNSTIEFEAIELSGYCEPLTERGVHYITPPAPMPMTQHWNWAMDQFLELSESSHVAYLTDRMLFKPENLAEIVEIARRYPDHLLSYNHDRIVDHKTPIRLFQLPWTGKIFEINSGHLLLLVSRAYLHNCLPRMLNSVVPRTKIEEIRSRYGNTFDSISPDFSFCFRVLEMFNTILFFDKSVLINYALYRSNGESLAIGKNTSDHADFVKNLGDKPQNYAAPVPEFLTVYNAICHEYCLLQSQLTSGKFHEIDRRAYLKAIAYEVSKIENPQLRIEMEGLLSAHGWQDTERGNREQLSLVRKLFSPSRVANKLKWISAGAHTKKFWFVLLHLFGLRPPDNNRFGFATIEEAVGYAKRFPRRKEIGLELLEPLVSASERGAPSGSCKSPPEE